MKQILAAFKRQFPIKESHIVKLSAYCHIYHQGDHLYFKINIILIKAFSKSTYKHGAHIFPGAKINE